MKMLYIAAYNIKTDIGIYKKITSQISAFEKIGIQTRLIKLNLDVTSLLNDKLVYVKQNWQDIQVAKDIDALYIRYNRCCYEFIHFLRKTKKTNPKIKILIEVPTYPYDKEALKEDKLIMLQDQVFRKLLNKYVDRIITFSSDKSIFGIKTIRAVNGIDFSEISERVNPKKENESIDLIAVATMKKWHGYDRLLEGMGLYYKNGGKRIITLHLVGTGPEINQYKSIIKKYDISKNVILYGNKQGKELDELYDICDVGVVSLGCYRIGISRLSAIKTREYAAKGLPMILSGYIDVFPQEKYNFLQLVPEDDTPVNIEQMIAWYDELYGINGEKRVELAKNIRQIGFMRCDSSVALKPIFKYLGLN